MKYLEEFRDAELAKSLVDEIRRSATREWVIMEVCGGQTHSIVRNGIDQLLAGSVELVHGPGCPVCVTPLEMIDKAIAIAALPGVIFTSFGDMLRVPGSEIDLLTAKSRGADIRVVLSPLDAVRIARENREQKVVFFSVGFETTAPTTAMAVLQAQREGITNFSLLPAHVLVPPAMSALLSSDSNRVQGYLAAGHVCAVMGWESYEPIAAHYNVPIVVTGFEPLDLLAGILAVVKQLETGKATVDNRYSRVVTRQGNRSAQEAVTKVFRVVSRRWRGLGEIPHSGLGIRTEYEQFDAEKQFELSSNSVDEPADCLSGLVLQGRIKPSDCPAFGAGCTPAHPLGATMVSSEGACAAYFKYKQFLEPKWAFNG